MHIVCPFVKLCTFVVISISFLMLMKMFVFANIEEASNMIHSTETTSPFSVGIFSLS